MSNPYIFYSVMKYPLPLPKEREFLKFNESKLPNHHSKTFQDIPANQEVLNQLIDQIKKYQHLLQKIPFLRGAFVVNSISFRGVHTNSDIDLFLVVRKNRLWIARLFAWRVFRKVKITKKHKYKRFCLSFWAEEDQINLQKIALEPMDIYLIYWIAHAVPIFADRWDFEDFYRQNRWIKEFLPHWEPRPLIDLNIPILKDKSFGTSKIENLLQSFLGNFLNGVIYFLWRPIMLVKANLNQEKLGVGTIIKKGMVKFHKDIREKIIKAILG